MSDILAKILEHKKQEIQAAARVMPEKVLRLHAEKSNGRRSLHERLSSPGPSGVNIIAEIKRASPSKGQIRGEVDPKLVAGAYERGGAAAISVLTDSKFFGGSPVDLRTARSAVGVPVLRKDFLIDPYQVYESAVIGADAVLLIVRALSPELLLDLLALCDCLGLDALVEVHNGAELGTALSAGARIIGINNRDLETFRTDIKTSIELSRHAGPGHAIVSESGIHGRSDVERLLDAGIFNFLIGEALMRSDDPELSLRVLQGAAR